MQIEKIEKILIHGLFGTFDHFVPLNIEEGITIIHGPNGFGKTTILRLIYDFFNQHNNTLLNIPFSEFNVKILNGYWLKFDNEKEDKYIAVKTDSGETVGAHITIPLPPGPIWPLMQVHLIESQRLLDIPNSNQSDMLPSTIRKYSSEMAASIKNALAQYSRVSQQLDRTFPLRAFNNPRTMDHFNKSELKSRILKLEETQSHLISVGLLDKFEVGSFLSSYPIFENEMNDDVSKKIFSIYIDDAEEKLHSFDDISPKLNLFQKIINHKFSCSDKEISFNSEEGFVILNSHIINVQSYLSSGEQHELVMLYELLFKVKPGSLVLIDEPELSLHVGWQVDFLKDLQEIIKLTNIQILIATHSPDIIQDRWDLTVELKGPQA